MKLIQFAFLTIGVSDAAQDVSRNDLKRARAKVPGSSFKGASFAEASEKLNKALERSSVGSMLVACDQLSVAELQGTMKALMEARNEELGAIYSSTNDARAMRINNLALYDQEWTLVANVAPVDSELAHAAHDMMCHEAVMLYVHHLTAEKRSALVTRGDFSLPKLPVGERRYASTNLEDLEPKARIIVDAYLRSTGCAACHTDTDGLAPERPSLSGAPKWPPAAEPVIPWRWSADLGGWMVMNGQRTNFTGSFHYDYTRNRLKEHWVVRGAGMEIINYWFGAPGPDGESTKDMPEGAARGHIYQVMSMGGKVISCRDDTYPSFSIVRPDAFIKQWHNDAKNLHYLARENMSGEDMGGVTGWADHWMYADTCGNFSLWTSLESGLPVYTRGPTGCLSGNAGNSYLNHQLVAPEDSLFQYNFSACVPSNQSAGLHKALWGFPAEAVSSLVVI